MTIFFSKTVSGLGKFVGLGLLFFLHGMSNQPEENRYLGNEGESKPDTVVVTDTVQHQIKYRFTSTNSRLVT